MAGVASLAAQAAEVPQLIRAMRSMGSTTDVEASLKASRVVVAAVSKMPAVEMVG
jgi:hypothetical protein